jgi:hypothetical protein
MAITCNVFGCKRGVSRPAHEFCYKHWQADQAGELVRCDKCGKLHEKNGACLCQPSIHTLALDNNDAPLSSTKLGEQLGISATRINLILAELGWIEKYVKGWQVTEHGQKLGGQCREARQTGIPYVVWPAAILNNKILLASVREQQGDTTPQTPEAKPKQPAKDLEADDFRTKFPATHRAADGHCVRSRAEMLIDNWLYMQGIVHAVERKLPIEEGMYCDFYLPKGKVYIEFWGMEKDPKYLKRKADKKALYAKYKLNLVELNDTDIMNLDDILPRLLLRYSIDCT